MNSKKDHIDHAYLTQPEPRKSEDIDLINSIKAAIIEVPPTDSSDPEPIKDS